MKKFQIVGLALVAVFAFSAFSTMSASAAFCAKGGTTIKPKWTTKVLCEAMGPEEASGEWWLHPEFLVNSASIASGGKVAVSSELISPIKLKDAGTGVEVECTKGTDTGSLLPEGLDEEAVVAVVQANCKVIEGTLCPELTKVEAVNLPWSTELYEEPAGMVRDHITKATNSPGWLVECKKVPIVGTVDDICTTNVGNVLVENEATSKDLDLEFDATSAAVLANCTVGGAEKGEILANSISLVLATGGEAIEVS